MTTIHCDIVSAEADIFHGDVAMVVADGTAGELGIAPRHEPLLTPLKPGQVEVVFQDGRRQAYYVSGGILEVQPETVTVLADSALRADEIDEAAVERAKEQVESIRHNNGGAEDTLQTHRQLVHAMAQLQALERLRRNLKH